MPQYKQSGIPFGSAKLNGKDGDSRRWAVRSTLLRVKRPNKVSYNSYEPAKREPVGQFLSEKDPPASPFHCADKECYVCSPQFFPANQSVTDVEARKIMALIVHDIKTDLAFLRDTLAKHADFIVSRWKKKSREKRFNFLTEHTSLFDKKWAAIYLLDRVGVEDREYAGERNIPRVRTIRSQAGDYQIGVEMHTPESLSHANIRDETLASYKDSWFFPYLDAETLSEDATLFLSLLHHRTVNEPEKWLTFDNSNLVLVEHFAIMSTAFNPHSVVAQGSDYGKLVRWNADQAHHWETIGFTKARVLFTAQQKMMALLRTCVERLLDEATMPPTLVIHPKWQDMIATNFSRFQATFAWSTDFAKPFSDPPAFDARETAELIASRHRVTKDEMDRLQTDPEYVQMLVQDLRACQFFESFRTEDVMPWMIDYLLFETMHRESYWRQLAVEGERMRKCFNKLQESPSKKAKQDYDRTVYIVLDLCIETFACFEPQIEPGMMLQKGFDRNFVFEGSAKVKSTNRSFTTQDWFPEDILYWSLSTLGYDQNRPFTMDPSLNFAIIDHLCRTDQKQAARIGQTMLDRLSDMSVLTSIISSIRSDMTVDRAINDAEAAKFVQATFASDWIKKINADHGRALGDTLGPLLEKLCYKHPWPRGKKDARWLEQATAARRSLTMLWHAYQRLWVSSLEKAGVSRRLIDEDIDTLRAVSNPQHVAELAAEKSEVQERMLQQAIRDGHKAQVVETQTVWGKENSSTTTLPTRTKAKPHLDSDQPKTANAVIMAPPLPVVNKDIPCSSSTISVKADSLLVFQHMYPNRGDESQRSFNWLFFLRAMIDAGFSILQSQGSAITLKLDDDADSRVKTIVIHRPHPVSTVNPVMLRCIAKRMEKWFGWNRGTFVERTKEVAVDSS
jgi:hypothetical protein